MSLNWICEQSQASPKPFFNARFNSLILDQKLVYPSTGVQSRTPLVLDDTGTEIVFGPSNSVTGLYGSAGTNTFFNLVVSNVTPTVFTINNTFSEPLNSMLLVPNGLSNQSSGVIGYYSISVCLTATLGTTLSLRATFGASNSAEIVTATGTGSVQQLIISGISNLPTGNIVGYLTYSSNASLVVNSWSMVCHRV
jgi:hypothetical protein